MYFQHTFCGAFLTLLAAVTAAPLTGPEAIIPKDLVTSLLNSESLEKLNVIDQETTPKVANERCGIISFENGGEQNLYADRLCYKFDYNISNVSVSANHTCLAFRDSLCTYTDSGLVSVIRGPSLQDKQGSSIRSIQCFHNAIMPNGTVAYLANETRADTMNVPLIIPEGVDIVTGGKPSNSDVDIIDTVRTTAEGCGTFEFYDGIGETALGDNECHTFDRALHKYFIRNNCACVAFNKRGCIPDPKQGWRSYLIGSAEGEFTDEGIRWARCWTENR
ncbi:hypothetical protein BU24DRAFT_458319 [Aaosphaeria arxii CBS 175.79]|uniref:Uncharacterized protein n=1 Tax=Aaosphaeria arxii CBS 175.79 TaxID=1450172 RepID=A0A6A5XZY3_9PLEO|nr:uncharacterized protein BU24DRAFT_458319 [Aaosphaeria arxii CBS 175.79]KAF2018559.1 hypothetical protein BU24DRAFT_458319 [Aaosphaeria arxii CBS 175.79]